MNEKNVACVSSIFFTMELKLLEHSGFELGIFILSRPILGNLIPPLPKLHFQTPQTEEMWQRPATVSQEKLSARLTNFLDFGAKLSD